MPLPSDLCRHFTLEEIIAATDNFDENMVIGKGGFGIVYKGLIDNASTDVAIKKLKTCSTQGAREFLTEIEMLSRLRHLHLVSLIGYCNDNGEMILVYDYMPHGTLRDHLYKSDTPRLNWKQRLQICIGAGKGLHYLHTGAKHAIIHRDVKSTNILVDSNWVAKVSDFGLCKIGLTDPSKTYVSTAVKGSIGYIDPEYYRLRQLTVKSDVFSFGVVLFEVLCGRPAIVHDLPMQQANLATWAKTCYREGTTEQMVDPNIKREIAPECLYKFVKTAIKCIRDEGKNRPAMFDVVWSLELAMELEAAAGEEGGSSWGSTTATLMLQGRRDPNTSEEMFPSATETASSSKNNSLHCPEVFSEDIFQTGR